MRLRAYIHHKRAEKYSDCQDCFGIKITPECNHIAISDGMSQSIYPQWWAKILVDSFLEMGTTPIDISRCQKIWQEKVKEEIIRRETSGKNPWRLKNSIAEKSGAGATLCGLNWTKDKWRCECLGDSCLIAITKDYGIKFYTSQVGEFGNHPDYYDSFNDGKGEVKIFSGNFNDSEVLLMVTDPFSELFQKHQAETNFVKERISEILNISDHQSFVGLVENWRDKFNMHNDDSTLIVMSDFASGVLDLDQDKLDQLCDEERDAEFKGGNDRIYKEKAEIKPLLQEKELESNVLFAENCDVNSDLKTAVRTWLSGYSGKMKDGKIKDALWCLVYPIVKEFIKKNKNK